MMLLLLLLVFAVALVPSALAEQCLSANDFASRPGVNDRAALYTGEQAFSLAMLREMSQVAPTENIFFSPYSTYHALLLAYFGAANATEDSLRTALHIPAEQDKLATMQVYHLEKLLRSMNVSNSYEFRSSNRVYVSDRLQIRPCMNHLFINEVQSIDIYSDPEAARQQINQWVQNETRDQIRDLIPGLSRDASVVLVNAAYFKGMWQAKFLPENTRKEVFHISHSKQALVDMMKQKGSFNYLISDRLGAHVLEMPYKGEEISMFILLPPFLKSNGVDTILKRLDTEGMKELLDVDVLSPQTVEVEIPKFTVETSQDITPVLGKLGVGDAFTQYADFSGFTGNRDVLFDSAIHKAKIEVNEEGTTAAAATALFLFRSARPLNPAKFVCNHPFIYLLFDRVSQSILFAGIYRSPRN